MQVHIGNISFTSQEENFQIIQKCINAILNFKTLEQAFHNIQNELGGGLFWKVSRGVSHIWVLNHCHETILLITE